MPTYKRLISKVGGLLGLIRVETETGEASYSVDKGASWSPLGGVRVKDVSYSAETHKLTFTNSDSTTKDVLLSDLIIGVSRNATTGTVTFTKADASTIDIEIGLDDFLADADYDPDTHMLNLTMSDSTVIGVDMSTLVSGKADLVSSATVNSIPTLSSTGNLQGTAKVFGGNTFNATPNVSTIPSESSVKAFADATYVAKDGAVSAGFVSLYAASTPPTGYLECNGAAVSRTTYASLYDVIGTTYGVGDGSTTFNLPDMRGVVARGLDNGRGLDSSRTFGSYQDDAFQGHYHTIQYGGGTGQSEPMKLTYSYATQFTGNLDVGVLAPRSDGTNGTPRTAGETRMKNVALLYIIKY